MRLTIIGVLLVALAGCQRETPERVLEKIAAAHEDYELDVYFEQSRMFLKRFPDHTERDRIRYEMAEQMAATSLMNPRSARAVEARTLLAEAAEGAKTKQARFDAALLLLKFTPEVDADAEARSLVERFEGQPGLEQIYFWVVTKLVADADTKRATAWATELLARYPKFEGRATYEAIARRGRLLGEAPPLEPAIAKQIGYADKVLLIDFWASWCAPCVAALPRIGSFYDAHAADGFDVLGVSLDEDDAVYEAFTKEHRVVGLQVRSKGEDGIDEAFGVRQLPSYVVVDRGRIVELELSGEPLFDALKALMAAHRNR